MIIHIFPLLALLNLSLPASAQGIAPSELDSDLLRYMRGASADPACGVCLGAARDFFAAKKRERLAKKTAGMARVPAGRYLLGSPEGAGDPDERPAAEIQLDAFYLDKTEVTIADYLAFVRTTGANHPEWLKPGGRFNIETGQEKYYTHFKDLVKSCPACPVFGVAWKDAAEYCAFRKKRLPTEAEWEAAARGDSTAPYSFGDSAVHAGEYAWYEDNSDGQPRPVGTKKPNVYGLYDMHGNVWEWVADFYDKAGYAARDRRNPQGPAAGRERVIRGGSWAFDAESLRSANRASTMKPNDDIGFRCATAEKDVLAE